MKKVTWMLLVFTALGLSGCAQVTEAVNGAGRSIEGFFSPGR
jgi:hypothetical protein